MISEAGELGSGSLPDNSHGVAGFWNAEAQDVRDLDPLFDGCVNLPAVSRE